MADFGLGLYNLTFLFNLNKNISKTFTEVIMCLKPFCKHCLKKKNYFYLHMCFVYIGFEIINNVQDLSVYAVVKAIIFLSMQLYFWKLIYFIFAVGVKTLFL